MLILSLCCVYSTIRNYWELLNCVHAVWRVTSCEVKSCPKMWEEFHAKPNESFSHAIFVHPVTHPPLQDSTKRYLWGSLRNYSSVHQLARGVKSQTGWCWYHDTLSLSFAWETMLKSTASRVRHTWDAGKKDEREENESVQGETLIKAHLLRATLEAA